MKKIGFGKLAGICFAAAMVLPAVFISVGVGSESVQDAVLNVSLVLLWASIAFFVAWLVVRWKAGAGKRAEKRSARLVKREEQRLKAAEYNSPENKAKRREKAESDRRYRELCKKYAQERKEADNRPVSAVLIGTSYHKSALSTVTRAMVFGLAGAASGTSRPTHATFSVKYASGRTATETVPVGSKRFNELSALLHG